MGRLQKNLLEKNDDNDDDDDDNDDEDDYSRFRVFGHNSPKNIFLGLKPKNELLLCKNTTFLLNKFFSRFKVEILTFFDGDDDFGDDDEDEYRCNSVNSQDRTCRFCMEVDLDNTDIDLYEDDLDNMYNMMM